MTVSADDFATGRALLLEDPDLTGARLRRALARQVDDWLRSLFVDAGPEVGTALVAVGGYGRGELLPGSDLDLLLLQTTGARCATNADRIWYPIWDAGLRLDHSVRTTVEARKLAATDLRVLLGLLDARLVAGDPELLAVLRAGVLDDWRMAATSRLGELRRFVEQRRESHGDLAHLLEPDLKESYGGLRDVNVLRAIAASWVVSPGVEALTVQVESLLSAREALHRVTGRSGDRLVLQEQEAVAAKLGLAGADELLRRVCSAGRSIAFTSDLAWEEVTRVLGQRGRLRGFRRRRPDGSTRVPLAPGVVVQDGEVVLALDVRPELDPVLPMRAAAAAAQADLRLSRHTVERLARECPPLPTPWPAQARDALVSLLGAGRSAVPVWEALDQAGLIERMIPEWGHVRSAPQHNPVHRFTVDRHLVEAAANASELTRRVSRPDLLLVGALLHDIGKGLGVDHTPAGVEIVARLAPELGFDESDSAILVSLVRHHLLLPETATRRDLTDPATVDSVVREVGSVEVLELLAVLTEADALAAGPAAWTPWKAALVAELVGRARARLAGVPVSPRPNLTAFQLRLAGEPGVLVDVEPGDGVQQVTVAADDRVGLLAAVAGVLALHRLAVRSARTQTVGERAVTTWVVTAEFGSAPDPARLRDDVRRALAGTLDLAAGIRRRIDAYRRPVTLARPGPRVDVVPDASESATVIEVRAHDAPGLMFLLAGAIAGVGIRIEAARASTMGSEAVDVFYLSDGAGGLLDQDRVEAVRSRIMSTLATEI